MLIVSIYMELEWGYWIEIKKAGHRVGARNRVWGELIRVGVVNQGVGVLNYGVRGMNYGVGGVN